MSVIISGFTMKFNCKTWITHEKNKLVCMRNASKHNISK